MKKILSTSLLLVLIIPQIALASWWNPLSWFSNWSFIHKTDTKVQVLEKRKGKEERNPVNIATSTIATTTEVLLPDKKQNEKAQEKTKPVNIAPPPNKTTTSGKKVDTILTSTPTAIPSTVAPTSTEMKKVEVPEITSVVVSPNATSAKFEWQTNVPTDSKVFISNSGSLSSMVFRSESGLSTHHITTITGLSASTTYSYEIEAVAGGAKVVKKQGDFKTAPQPPIPITPEVKKELEISNEGCLESQNGVYCDVVVRYFENGILVPGVPVTIFSNDGGTFSGSVDPSNPATVKTKQISLSGGTIGAYFVYSPSEINNRILTAKVNEVTATLPITGQLKNCVGKVATDGTGCNKLIVKDLTVTANKKKIPLSGFHRVSIEAKYTEDGKPLPATFTFFSSDGVNFNYALKYCSGDPNDCKETFTYLPKDIGNNVITITAGGISKTVTISVIPYVKVDPVLTFEDNNAVIPHGGGGPVLLGSLHFSEADEPVQLQLIKAVSEVGNQARFSFQPGSPWSYVYDEGKTSASFGAQSILPIEISLGVDSMVRSGLGYYAFNQSGNFTYTITDIEAIGLYSNRLREIKGLPITFHYTVQ